MGVHGSVGHMFVMCPSNLGQHCCTAVSHCTYSNSVEQKSEKLLLLLFSPRALVEIGKLGGNPLLEEIIRRLSLIYKEPDLPR